MNEQNNPVSQPTPTNPPTLTKSSSFLVTLLSLLLLLAVAAAGFFAYQTQSLVKQLAEYKSVSSTTPTPLASPAQTAQAGTPDPTADWETYQNNIFTFKHPSDLEIKEQDGNIAYFTKWGPTQKAETELFDAMSVRIQPREINLTAKEYALTKIEEVGLVGLSTIESGLEEIVVGSHKGYTYTIEGLGIHKIIILQSKGGMIIEITDSTVDPGNLGFKETVAQILSTFEFVEN